VAAALAVTFGLYGCASPSSPPGRPPRSVGRVKLRVLLPSRLSSAPFFIAADGGFFAEQGLDVEFVKIVRTADALTALAHGDLDVWTGAVSFALLNLIARDNRVKVVSDKGYFAPGGCSYSALMVRRTLIETGLVLEPRQLRGRRVAVNATASFGYFMEKLLGPVGLSLADVQVVDIPEGEGAVVAEALRSGSVDAAFVLEPWVTRIQQTNTAEVFASAAQVMAGYQHMVTAFGPSLLVRNPGAGRRFMNAYLRAVRQYNEGKTARNLQVLAKNTGFDVGLLQEACWPSVRDDGRVDLSSMADFQRWGLRRGFLDRVLAPSQFWDATFVDYANQAPR
jgi:NitT/TauT family transport system substrate-binding protein